MPKTQTKRGLSPRELDALRKQFIAEQKQADSASKWQLANDIVSGINDIVGRGVIAPILGMPGDINQAIYDAGAWVNNKIKDVEVATGMVKQPRYVQPSQGNAYLGSEDIGNRMQQAGLVSSERRPMTELAASFISPSAAAKTAINAPKTAMNMLRMADNLEAPSRGVRNAQGMYIPRGQMGAIENLYHGSPHTFDRFDLSKIGTGEGAQAYGHGAYLAEGKGVAEWYQSQLGKYYDQISTPEGMMPLEAGLAKYHPDGAVMAKVANNFRKNLDVDSFNALVDDLYLPEIRATIPENEWGNFSAQSGNLYQARLAWPDSAREATNPLSPENFLDWDKPLSEQSAQVKKAISSMGKDDEWKSMVREAKREGMTAGEFYDLVAGDESGYPFGSEILSSYGIPGIRYLDAGSRGAGEGSRNYVVFDDNLIDIVSRNNQPIRKAEAPQAKALREAQINAAKPVSEGGLGLRPDNTPEERAMAMGYTTDAYHGTFSDILRVSPKQANSNRLTDTPYDTSLVSSSNPNVASTYAINDIRGFSDSADWSAGSIYPLKVRGENVYSADAQGKIFNDIYDPHQAQKILDSSGLSGVKQDALEELVQAQTADQFAWMAKDRGGDMAVVKNVYDPGGGSGWPGLGNNLIGDTMFHFDPRNIRSRFAAFDPMRRDSSDLLAGIALPVVAAPVVSESDKKKRKDKKK
jgi:hypothetical protein